MLNQNYLGASQIAIKFLVQHVGKYRKVSHRTHTCAHSSCEVQAYSACFNRPNILMSSTSQYHRWLGTEKAIKKREHSFPNCLGQSENVIFNRNCFSISAVYTTHYSTAKTTNHWSAVCCLHHICSILLILWRLWCPRIQTSIDDWWLLIHMI